MRILHRAVRLGLVAPALALIVCGATGLGAQAPSTSTQVPLLPQTQDDDYTSYELLDPATAQFRILYDVTATRAGAAFFFNAIRKGSVASDERVIALASGEPLRFEVVSGADARRDGHPRADLDTEYIKVWLPRPVPEGGEARLRIDKTYKDAASYRREGDGIVFSRSLGIKRNKIVLPPGYELTGCNTPAQVRVESDGRLSVSFVNLNPNATDLVVRARPMPAGAPPFAAPVAARAAASRVASDEAAPSLARSAALPISERAFQDREIVYHLQPPETNAFDISHDYTETRVGVGQYVNVVRAGSRVSNPSATNLDTGEALRVRTLVGSAIADAKVDPGQPITPALEVVVIDFPPVTPPRTTRLRIRETYTDPARYGVVDGVLVWHRGFGRPRNAVVLPAGWALTASSVPATVVLTGDGRVRLDFVNPRTDEIDVLIRASRRSR